MQGALWDRHRQIEALLGRKVPLSSMMTGQGAEDGAGALTELAYEARVEAMRREFPEQLAGIESRGDLNARLSGRPTIVYYDTDRGPVQVQTLGDGSLWLEAADGFSGPLSRFSRARPIRRSAASDAGAATPPIPTWQPRVRSLGERFTSTLEDAVNRNPLMALGRWAVGGGYDEYEDPETGQTIRYASFGQQARDQERERRASYQIMAENDAWDSGDANFLLKGVRGATTLAGAVAGAAADPLNLISPGQTAVGRVVGGIAVNAAGDAVTQGADIGAGIERDFNPAQTAAAGLIGGVIQGGIEGAGAAARAVNPNPGGVVGAVASEIDLGSRASPARRAAQHRVEGAELDAFRIGEVSGAAHQAVQAELDALRTPLPLDPIVEKELDDLLGQTRVSGVGSPDVSPAPIRSDGPADRPAVELGAAGDAGGIAGGPVGGALADPADAVHLDQNHVDLYRLGETSDPDLAADLSRRMSRFMDWSDVTLGRRDRLAVEAGEPVSARAMIVAARHYRETGGGGSFYDPDKLGEVMRANRGASEPAAPTQSVDYQGRRIQTGTFDPMRVEADPATFQYKAAGDDGLTDRLSGVTQWDRTAAGRSILYERADGSVVVADGHQRRGLARRLIETGQDKTAMLDGFLFRQADGWEPGDVRVVAALKNIREGSGSILDAAKVFREDPARIGDRSLPITGDFIANARGLARLSDEAFGAVANGVISDRHGAVIGQMVADRPDLHLSIVDLVRQAEPKSLDEVRALVQEARLADFAETSGMQGDMFGGAPAQSTLIARARLRATVLKQLRADSRLFASLIRNADAIEAGGNALARTENEARLAQDMAASAAVDKLSLRAGQTGDIFGGAARSVARGDLTLAQAARDIVEDLRRATALADAVDADRAVTLNPRPPVPDAGLQGFDRPGGPGQMAQIEPKPEDAAVETATLWDDLPDIGEEQQALDALRVCAPGRG